MTTYGIPKDHKKALLCWYYAADYGLAGAQSNIAVAYSQELTRDLVEAFRWYILCAHRGMPESKFRVGNCYRWGWGVRTDIKECIRWYRLVADEGYPPAQERLAKIYEEGHEKAEITPNPEEALRLYRSAALQGLKSAQYELGCRYEKGKCSAKVDLVEACHWFNLAADQGCSTSRKKT